jgi:hypothetical protein
VGISNTIIIKIFEIFLAATSAGIIKNTAQHYIMLVCVEFQTYLNFTLFNADQFTKGSINSISDECGRPVRPCGMCSSQGIGYSSSRVFMESS